jgi:hypothetical protein
VFQLVCGRLPGDGHETASQPTLSRFENAVGARALLRLRDVLVEQFLDAFESPPARLTFDLDGFDDPAHGAQPLTLFHGCYKQSSTAATSRTSTSRWSSPTPRPAWSWWRRCGTAPRTRPWGPTTT